jgi:two-component system, chemotaxis family, chemotaxis protein CheY
MRALIVEDDFTCRLILQEVLKVYGMVHVAVNGIEAVEAMRQAMLTGEHYDIICMDIMMPEMDGHTALKQIRDMERKAGISGSDRVKIVMTTALSDPDNVTKAIHEHCDGYLVKPFNKASILEHLRKFGVIKLPCPTVSSGIILG